jgi:hypothetical protein
MSFEQQISYWMTSRIRALHLPVTAKEWDNATLETKIRMFGRLGDEKWATRTESCAGVKLICDHRAGLMQIGIGGLALAGGMLTGGLASAAVAGVLPETAATALVSAGAGGFAGGTTISGISQLLTTGHVDVGQALKQGAVGGVLAVATAGLGLGVQGAFRGVMARVAAGAADSEVVAGARLPQDVAVDPTAPRALPLDRPVGLSDTQNEFAQSRIGSLQEQGATDFRVNQQQVDMNGARVGVNRPDLQYTLNGQRYYEEFDRFSSWRGFEHQARIYANDPSGIVNLFWVE